MDPKKFDKKDKWTETRLLFLVERQTLIAIEPTDEDIRCNYNYKFLETLNN